MITIMIHTLRKVTVRFPVTARTEQAKTETMDEITDHTKHTLKHTHTHKKKTHQKTNKQKNSGDKILCEKDPILERKERRI